MSPGPASPPPPRADQSLVGALRVDLQRAGYTVDGVRAVLGPVADAALHREQPLPADLATRGRADAAPTLVRCFALGMPVARADLDHALPSLGADGARQLGLVASRGPDDGVRATCDLRPYADETHDWWLASDLSEVALGGPLPQDHVLGVGPASMTVAQWTPRRRVARALDLGTGCGVQALHLADHAETVVATDLSARALAFARFNALLCGLDVDLRQGDLLGPVAGERFDLVVSNPPFVITPRRPGLPAYEYRDAGLVGDAVVERLVRALPDHLAPGGVATLIGNWEVASGTTWRDRWATWLDGTGLDAWVVQRDEQDPAEYAELWSRDGGSRDGVEGYEALYAAWLADFAARGVERIGFGVVVLQRPGQPRAPWRDLVEVTGPVAAAMGPVVEAGLTARTWLTEHDDTEVLAVRWRCATDVVEERHTRPGADDPLVIQLRQGGALQRVVRLDTATAALVSVCDGTLPAAVALSAVAELMGEPAGVVTARVLPLLRELVADGLLRRDLAPKPAAHGQIFTCGTSCRPANLGMLSVRQHAAVRRPARTTMTQTEVPQSAHPSLDDEQVGYKQTLSRRHVQMIAIGGAIGTGLFLGSASRLHSTGPALLLSYAFVGAIAYLLMRALGELVLHRATSGAFVSYMREFYGEKAAYVTGWMYWLNWALTGIAELSAVGLYVQYWFPLMPTWGTVLIALAVVLFINLLSARAFGEFEFWAAIAKVGAIVIFLVVGLVLVIGRFDVGGHQAGLQNLWSNPGGFWPTTGDFHWYGPVLVMSGVVFAYAAIEMVGVAAGEMEDAKTEVPKAVNAVIFRIGVFYCGSILLLVSILPTGDFKSGISPFVTIFERMGATWMGAIIQAVLIVAALSSLNSGLYSTGRVLRSLGVSKQAPSFTLKMSKQGVPWAGIVMTSVVYVFGAVLNALTPDAFEVALEAAALGVLFTWGTIFLCQLKLRSLVNRGVIPASPFQMPGHPWTSIVGLIFLVLVLIGLAFEGWESSPYFWKKTDFLVVVIGVPLIAALLQLGWMVVRPKVVANTGDRLKAVWSNDGPTYGPRVRPEDLDPAQRGPGHGEPGVLRRRP